MRAHAFFCLVALAAFLGVESVLCVGSYPGENGAEKYCLENLYCNEESEKCVHLVYPQPGSDDLVSPDFKKAECWCKNTKFVMNKELGGCVSKVLPGTPNPVKCSSDNDCQGIENSMCCDNDNGCETAMTAAADSVGPVCRCKSTYKVDHGGCTSLCPEGYTYNDDGGCQLEAGRCIYDEDCEDPYLSVSVTGVAMSKCKDGHIAMAVPIDSAINLGPAGQCVECMTDFDCNAVNCDADNFDPACLLDNPDDDRICDTDNRCRHQGGIDLDPCPTYAQQDDFGRCVYAPGQCRTTENCEDGLLCKDASQETPGKCVECLVSWRDCSDEKFCDPDGNCRMPGSIENNCPPYAPADSFGRCAFRPGECRTGNDCEEDGQLCKDGSYTSPGKCVDCIEDKDCRPQCEFGNIDPECLSSTNMMKICDKPAGVCRIPGGIDLPTPGGSSVPSPLLPSFPSLFPSLPSLVSPNLVSGGEEEEEEEPARGGSGRGSSNSNNNNGGGGGGTKNGNNNNGGKKPEREKNDDEGRRPTPSRTVVTSLTTLRPSFG